MMAALKPVHEQVRSLHGDPLAVPADVGGRDGSGRH